MSQIKKLLDIFNYDTYIQDMIFGIADQWEEHIKEEFLQLLNEMPPVTEEERVLQDRNKEEFEDLPF